MIFTKWKSKGHICYQIGKKKKSKTLLWLIHELTTSIGKLKSTSRKMTRALLDI